MDAMEKDGAVFPDGAEGDRIRRVVDIIDGPISDALRSDSATEGLEIWQIHSEHISKVSSDGKRKRGCQKYHPMLMNWAMAFLSRTSRRTYNEVAKIMMLPCIGTVYRKTAEIISTKNDKAYCLHMNTIRSISDRADREGWTCHQRIGVIAQDSANINAGIEHDYVTNTLKGGDESHSVATLSRMFQSLAQRVKAAQCNENVIDTEIGQQNSILDNLPLAEEHLIFKFSSIDPRVKCSDIVASVNVTKVTSGVITSVMIALRDLLPMFGLEVGMATSDAAGCNWVSYRDTLSTHTYRDALPHEILDMYPTVDFDVQCLMADPATKQWIIFLPDMPHLTKNIVTALELSSSKNSKQNLKYGVVPVNMQMIEEVWLKCDGASGQLQSTKLTHRHFDKNAYSRMNVKLATQLLSKSTVDMIRNAIADDSIVLSLNTKGMYNHVADLCEHWNSVVDICNGRDGPHSPVNAQERQSTLLKTLACFSRWKQLHDERVAKKQSLEYIFFADETWFCIKSLLLAHVLVIHIYCITKGESVNPRTMNTDTVEWFFGDARQIVGGSTNKLTAAGFERASKKASTFNAAQFSLVGNNATGANMFGRNKF